MQAIQISAFGRPTEVANLVDLPEPDAPGTGEVTIAVEAAPIHPSDLLMMSGYYGYRPPLPAIMGSEGVGTVLSIGPDVDEVKVGDRVLIPYQHPTWRERVKIPARGLFPLPQELDVLQLSMLMINPLTAYLLLHEFVSLQPDEWIIQNSANSAVGQAVIVIAKNAGLRTVNIVRREELVEPLQLAGADVVLVDGPDLVKRIAEATSKAAIRLGLEGVGGESTLNLLKCLTDGGTAVIYAAMSNKPFTGQSAQVIFRDLTIRGFWLVKWFQTASSTEVTALSKRLLDLVQAGRLHSTVEAVYPFSQFREALAHAARQQRQGKILFRA